jgi:NitT/TauT family transport system substrate-binding protein
MSPTTLRARWAFALALSCAVASPAAAEVSAIVIVQQFGVSFLPLMVMERGKLVEKYAEKAGLKDVKTNWVKVAGPSVMNDGLLSNTMHFVAQGAPSMITLWDRTKGQIRGVAAMTTYPLYLITRNPNIKTVADLSSADKIAVPSVKISTQAIMLQMAAAKAFGQENYEKFDPLTISLSHPDATLAFLNNTAGVNAHFSSSPFYEQEMKAPGARLLTTNYEILGGPATAVVITANSKFVHGNPKSFGAFVEALKEAIDTINKDKRAAAALYLDIANDKKNSVDDILKMIGDKDYIYTLRPQKVLATANFMAKIGSIKQDPKTVEDLFFPDVVKGLNGN